VHTVTPELEARARELRDQLTLDEKVRTLSGSKGFYSLVLGAPGRDKHQGSATAGDVARVGIKGFVYSDGPRGITESGSTCFPVPMARAATFSPELEERVGEAVGREARALGKDLVLAPCINLLRHPAWGRAQETYGEDPELLGDMGAAFTRGVQKHALACAKHFACNSIDDSRLNVDVRVDEEVLDKLYLPAFERVVREGVGSVMSAYNSVNGQWCSQNRRLLTAILKERWGFDGFVLSDWIFGVHDGPAAVNAGLDLEMPSPVFLGKRLLRAVKQGRVPLERIDDAVLRIIRQQLRVATLGDGEYGPEVVACDRHRALAREVATRAIVLLRNEAVGGAPEPAPRPVLPLEAAELKRLAVIGRLAAVPNLGDKGSSWVKPPYVITPLEGLRTVLEPHGVEVVHDDGSDVAAAAALAAGADAVVVVVGYDYQDEGENLDTGLPLWLVRRLPLPPLWALKRVAKRLVTQQLVPPGYAKGGDRKSLTLHAEDEDLLLAVAAANPRTVAVVMCGSAVLMERWQQRVPAILILWYPGMEGGHALADIVLGNERPTGRLPFAIPTSADHLPPFDPKAKVVEYGPLHGQALLDHLGVPAAYPYGFGLGYE
jgi:beta-glucosidase